MPTLRAVTHGVQSGTATTSGQALSSLTSLLSFGHSSSARTRSLARVSQYAYQNGEHIDRVLRCRIADGNLERNSLSLRHCYNFSCCSYRSYCL
jgi:hypothetical protein